MRGARWRCPRCRENRHAARVAPRRPRPETRLQDDVDVVDHQVEHDVDVGRARLERREPVDSMKRGRRCGRAPRSARALKRSMCRRGAGAGGPAAADQRSASSSDARERLLDQHVTAGGEQRGARTTHMSRGDTAPCASSMPPTRARRWRAARRTPGDCARRRLAVDAYASSASSPSPLVEWRQPKSRPRRGRPHLCRIRVRRLEGAYRRTLRVGRWPGERGTGRALLESRTFFRTEPPEP